MYTSRNRKSVPQKYHCGSSQFIASQSEITIPANTTTDRINISHQIKEIEASEQNSSMDFNAYSRAMGYDIVAVATDSGDLYSTGSIDIGRKRKMQIDDEDSQWLPKKRGTYGKTNRYLLQRSHIPITDPTTLSDRSVLLKQRLGQEIPHGSDSNEAIQNLAVNPVRVSFEQDEPPHDLIPLSVRRKSNTRAQRDRTRQVGSSGSKAKVHLVNSTNPSTQPSYSEIVALNNKLKVELLQARKDKRVYATAVASLHDQKKRFQKELKSKVQLVEVLENSLSRKIFNGKKKGTNPWGVEYLKDAGLANYHGICLSAGKLGPTMAKRLVTESYVDQVAAKKIRGDWTASSVAVNSEEGCSTSIYILLPDVTHAIPTCPTTRAKSLTFYTSRLRGPKDLLIECLNSVLSGPV